MTAELQGYCSSCPCWFDIPEPDLNAHKLCPCCLQPATEVRREPARPQGLLAKLLRKAPAS